MAKRESLWERKVQGLWMDTYVEGDLVSCWAWGSHRRSPRGSGWLAHAFQGFLNNRQDRPLQFSFLSLALTRHAVCTWCVFTAVPFSFSSRLPHSTVKSPGDRGPGSYCHPRKVSLCLSALLLGYVGRACFGRIKTLPQSLKFSTSTFVGFIHF